MFFPPGGADGLPVAGTAGPLPDGVDIGDWLGDGVPDGSGVAVGLDDGLVVLGFGEGDCVGVRDGAGLSGT